MKSVDQVLEAAAKIVADFARHDAESYFSNFAESATFVFYTHDRRLNSRSEYQELWKTWEERDGFRVHGCKSTDQLVQLISEDGAIFSHSVETQLEFAGDTTVVNERETIVFELLQGKWVAVHEHLSPVSPS
ncbi:MAG: nuclear transport factor 2 family protein [Actinomycetales bacterium]|nr:nuclear transport factor 2 family protein [Actinomycetales bacterium]